MKTNSQEDQPDHATLDSNGEVSRRDSLQTRHKERRVGIEVQNVTDFLGCLSIASMSFDQQYEYEEEPQVSDSDKEKLPVAAAQLDASLENHLEYTQDNSDNINREMQDHLYRKNIELDRRAERLRASVDSESKKLDEANRKFNQMISHVDSLSEDIDDFIDENPVRELGNSLEDIDLVISKVEKMRSDFRTVHKELRMNYGEKRYRSTFEVYYKQKLDQIKLFICEVRYKRKSIRDVEDKVRVSQHKAHERKLEFVRSEIKHLITHFSNKFDVDLADEDDEEIKKRKEELTSDLKMLGTIPKKIEELMNEGEDEHKIDCVQDLYKGLSDAKDTYIFDLDAAFKTREIEKQKNFNRASLNIKLPKFNGFQSKLDIYTFQDQFEKLNLKAYPKSALPDLLKNNYLSESPLMLVRDVTDIDDIWERLKAAYGDTKHLLKQKLSELNGVENVSKSRDSSKAIDALSQIINLMKDLLQLSKRHKIENHLFYGDGLNQVFRLMGEGRVNRWLSEREDGLFGEPEWLAVIQFLEKELKICQQKVLIFHKTPDRQKDSTNRNYHADGIGNTDRSNNLPAKEARNCHICGASDHVTTIGPGYKKIIQYFVCPRWAGMTNAERLNALRQKGLCSQCLFPGAGANKGKHALGKCQRDFTCKHQSHDSLTTKKHVLVCEEHKDTQANKELLEEFRKRCILKKNQDNLPAHAKEIKISAHYIRSPNKLSLHSSDGDVIANSNITRTLHDNGSTSITNPIFNNPTPSPNVCDSLQTVNVQALGAHSSLASDSCQIAGTKEVVKNSHHAVVNSSSQDGIIHINSSRPPASLLDASEVTVDQINNSQQTISNHQAISSQQANVPPDGVSFQMDDSSHSQCRHPFELDICPPVVMNRQGTLDSTHRIDIVEPSNTVLKDTRTIQSTSYATEHQKPQTPFIDSVQHNAVYMLQRVVIEGEVYNIFYDSGAGDFVSRHSAVQRLSKLAHQTMMGPLIMRGVGDIVVKAPHGMYGVTLPLADGGSISMNGMCLETLTETFPEYRLKDRIEKDIQQSYQEAGGYLHDLPMLSEVVGGDTDMMIGSKYRCIFPIEIFRLPSGLSICQSYFKNVDGSRGVICGPHEVIDLIDKTYNHHASTFLTQQCLLFKYGYQINPDVSMLSSVMVRSLEDDLEDSEDPLSQCYSVPKTLTSFTLAEMAGSEITYTCPKCRQCADCKNYEHSCAVTIQAEEEQALIEDSVHVDIVEHVSSASLPLLANPEEKLAPNLNRAKKTYDQQVKRLTKDPEDKKAVIDAEAKLQQLGFVEWVKNLPKEDQKMLRESPLQNFIPWRHVFKESTTTPCRPVFDASQPTGTGVSLNDITAKGTNMLNLLVEIFLRWRLHRYAFHCDVQKMYNAVQLNKEHWCLQRYLFQKDLEPTQPPEEKVIKTLIYGVRSSGNQAQCALRKTAAMFKTEYPDVHRIVTKDVYMDDCMSGGHTVKESTQRQKDLQHVLSQGGFSLKGFSTTGRPPDKSLSLDGVNVFALGNLWDPEKDTIALNIKDINFAKKVRGRKSATVKAIPKKLTKRHCAAKTGEIYDYNGLVVPLVGGIKVDLHELSVRKLKWDDVLPDFLREIWCSHFQMMEEIKNLRWKRAVIPENAVDLNCTTLDFGDASRILVCVAIYVRFKLTDGNYSTQLIFAKSRLVPDDMTQPRAELYAALVNTHAGEVVRRALGAKHQGSLKFTDSQIVLYWVCKNDHILKQWARNRVIEIKKFTNPKQWRYIKSEDMVADIGTRRCSSIEVVKEDSPWIQGYQWMRDSERNFPMMSADEVTLKNIDFQNMRKEVKEDIFKLAYVAQGHTESNGNSFSEALLKRYQLSKYVIDPNYRRYTDVVRILALVKRFVNNLKTCVQKRKENNVSSTSTVNQCEPVQVVISDEEIKAAKLYFFQKATSEVKHFLKPSQYKDISLEKNGILTYSGRILPTDNITILGRTTDVMKDLTSTMFCVPLVDKDSPLAYSIISDIHWNHPTASHCGVDTVWRYVLQHCYILDGRAVLTKISKSCERCRYLNKKFLQIAMGLVSPHNLIIAPAFYVCQVDLTGPYLAYCHHHKRNTIKIWLVVFCCATTATTSIKLMEDYSTTAFVQAFTRFSCDTGFPKTLLCDEGSQLIKGNESMQLKFWDIKFQLHKEYGVNFEVCPVGGHNWNGRVERTIQEIKKSISKSVSNERLSVIQWETLSSAISNSINNRPLAIRGSKSNIEALDLLTPNRLKLARNNDRSPEGCVTVAHPDKVLEDNERVFNAWFELWLSVHVPKLMDRPKWFKSDESLKPGDVVLFSKHDSVINSNYQYGIVDTVHYGRDNKIRSVTVRYRNSNENVDRTTTRSVRGLVVIHRTNEINIMEELGEVSRMAEQQRFPVLTMYNSNRGGVW